MPTPRQLELYEDLGRAMPDGVRIGWRRDAD